MTDIDLYLAQDHIEPPVLGFLELAPENWLEWHGQYRQLFESLSQQIPMVAHGLSLSLGGPDPLQVEFLHKTKKFLDRYNIEIFSEHLSFCSADGHLYDLMPIPFTTAMVGHVADRIRQTQDILKRRICVENISYYTTLADEMSELDFVCEVIKRADCDLLLDVNNVFVNSRNHNYDPVEFLQALPSHRIRYLHVAGHESRKSFTLDSHGAAVDAAVWQLLRECYRLHGVRPTLLERDFNFPPFRELIDELTTLATLQSQSTA